MDYEEKVQLAVQKKQYSYMVQISYVMQPERLRNDSNASKVQNYKNYELNEMGMWERTLSEGKIKFFRVRSVLTGYVLPKMKRVAKMKCSAIVDAAGGRAGRTGTKKLERRTDRRNLSVLMKNITDTISICTIYRYQLLTKKNIECAIFMLIIVYEAYKY